MGARLQLPVEFFWPSCEAIRRHFVGIEVGFDERFNKTIKEIPGVVWSPAIGADIGKKWLCPIEMQEVLGEAVSRIGYLKPEPLRQATPIRAVYKFGMHPWQVDAEAFLIHHGYGALMFSPGLGKSRPAIEAAVKCPGRCLWICPAMTRQTIAREIEKWAPGADVGIVGDRKRQPNGQRFIVCSYQMLPRILESESRFSTIVLDEFHNIANKKAQRSKWVRELVEHQAPDLLALLSGTPTPNRPHNLWHPLDLMCPGRFGTEWKFQERYCLGPATKILKSNLRWERIDSLQRGDELLGFDEECLPAVKRNGHRRFRITKVLAVNNLRRPCYKLTFSDGREVISSSDHQWLCSVTEGGGAHWRTTELVAEKFALGRGRWFRKYFTTWSDANDADSGYIAGIFDGEGNCAFRRNRHQLAFAQKEGVVLEKSKKILQSMNVPFVERDNHQAGIRSCHILGTTTSKLALLGTIRAERLIQNTIRGLKEDPPAMTGNGEDLFLVRAEFIGEQPVVAIETDSRTFFAEGLASHNCIIGSNGYGRTVGGLNPAFADELRMRLAAIGVRATEEDAVGYLPPLNICVEWQEATSLSGTLRNEALDDSQFMVSATDQKIRWAKEVLEDEIQSGRKTAIVCWHRDVAEQVAASQNLKAIHGGMTPAARDQALNDLAADPEAPLVCTMASIAEGLNQLVAWSSVVLAETYYRPASVAQALKRFHRLTSLRPVTVRVLGLVGTRDEKIIDSLVTKVQDINQLIRAGAVEGAIGGLVESTDLNSMLDGWTGGDT